VWLQLTDEHVRLMRYQFRLEEEFKKSFLDLSLHETIYELILNNNVKLVEQLRKEFHIPDRRFVRFF
jgi:vacuolar protein sorting-associated protein 16